MLIRPTYVMLAMLLKRDATMLLNLSFGSAGQRAVGEIFLWLHHLSDLASFVKKTYKLSQTAGDGCECRRL